MMMLVRSVLDQSASWNHVWLSWNHGVVHALEQVIFSPNIFCTTCERCSVPTGGLVFATAIRKPPHKRETAIWRLLFCLATQEGNPAMRPNNAIPKLELLIFFVFYRHLSIHESRCSASWRGYPPLLKYCAGKPKFEN